MQPSRHSSRRVAFQGEHGAYSELAIAQLWPGAECVPFRENHDVVRAVEGAEVDAGLLALENSLAGTVTATVDALLAATNVQIVGETIVPIHHCLLALPGATIDDIRWVESHPVALAQCQALFARHPALAPRTAYDTAGAARDIAVAGDRSRAALASAAAAPRYGLSVLLENVEDRPDNRTRFIGLARGVSRAHADRIRGIRGAISIPRDDRESVREAVTELVAAVQMHNAITPEQIISAIFTTTPDITCMFPAMAAREAGWGDVPLLCATEIAVPGSLPLCIRVLVHVELPATRAVEHVYLGAATALRPDLAVTALRAPD